MTAPLNVAALISGSGRTVINILDQIEEGKLNARITKVISSRKDAKGVQLAKLRGVDTAVVPSRDFRRDGHTDWEAMSMAINDLLSPAPDLLILAGYMCFYHIPPELEGRVMNIHPSLIPSFCGKHMHGHHVHEAVVEAGVKVSGCTVHFVNDQYDAGPIILQRTCPVHGTDTPDDVAARVFREELQAFPEAIRLFAEGRLEITDNRVIVRA
ncbi:MAG: phosphoribosylglycinamide formyltransferase [Planctomycetota bacterium]|jgi:formyltetrahydrofolate-dependent phosphoribosylglycinamide formyltransferase